MGAISELTNFVLLICIILYVLNVVFNLVKAQTSYMSGSKYSYGDALSNIFILSLLMAAAFVVSRGSFQPEDITGTIADGGGSNNISVWQNIAKTVVAVVVGTGTLLVVVNAVWTLAKGQAEHMIGRPWQVSELMLKIGGVLIGGAFSIGAAIIAQKLVDGIGSLIP